MGWARPCPSRTPGGRWSRSFRRWEQGAALRFAAGAQFRHACAAISPTAPDRRRAAAADRARRRARTAPRPHAPRAARGFYSATSARISPRANSSCPCHVPPRAAGARSQATRCRSASIRTYRRSLRPSSSASRTAPSPRRASSSAAWRKCPSGRGRRTALTGAAWSRSSVEAAVARLGDDFQPFDGSARRRRLSSAGRGQSVAALLRRAWRPAPADAHRRCGRGGALAPCRTIRRSRQRPSACQRRRALCRRHSAARPCIARRVRPRRGCPRPHRRIGSRPRAGHSGGGGCSRRARRARDNNYGSAVHHDRSSPPAWCSTPASRSLPSRQPRYAIARRAARKAHVRCEPLPAILDVRAALAAQSYVLPSARLVRGRPHETLTQAAHRLRGTVAIGGQDHFIWKARSRSRYRRKTARC